MGATRTERMVVLNELRTTRILLAACCVGGTASPASLVPGEIDCLSLSWASAMPIRRFPPPWSAEVTPNCFIVRDALTARPYTVAH
jgi:hypothetical protein